MRKLILIFMVIFSLLTVNTYAKKSENFTSTLDYADIISDSTERYIFTQNKTLFNKTNARVIFATVSDTGDMSAYDYAKELYDNLGIKNIGRNNSVFILLCPDEKDYCLIVSDGISATLTEAYAQKCLVEYMEKDFEKGNYDDAVIKTFNAFAQWYQDEYRTELELTEDMGDYDDIIKSEKRIERIKKTVVILLLIIVAIVLFAVIGRHRRRKKEEKLLKKRQERRRRYRQSLITANTKGDGDNC